MQISLLLQKDSHTQPRSHAACKHADLRRENEGDLFAASRDSHTQPRSDQHVNKLI